MATQRQLEYANAILEWLDKKGLLEDALTDLKPDCREEEGISDWFNRLSTEEMSEVINSLKEALAAK